VPTLLSINNYHYGRGGADSVFLAHNALFERSGWCVPAFCMQHPNNLPSPWSRYFVREIEFGRDYSPWQKLARIPKVIYSLEARHNLELLLREVHPDICHAHNIYHHLSPSILGLLKSRGLPVVLTLHDLKIACPAYNMLASDGVCERCRGGRVYNVLIHRCIKGSVGLSALALAEALVHRVLRSYESCVDRFVVPSRFYLEKFVEWGWPRAQFTYVPNFIDAQRYRPEYAPGQAFVYVGRMSREKGLVTLIRAAAAVQAAVTIAGTGPQEQELRQLAAQLGADVTFAGYRTGEALHNIIRGARAVVLPSECYENAPLAVLEAYALGKPVIGARIGGIPELLREGETGVGFISGDYNSLSEGLCTLTRHSPTTMQTMGRAARAWVEDSFDAATYRHRTVELYHELGAVPAAPSRTGEGIPA
jgi:glycosyltransferase involved in cell wall biosynthesis